ncbi:alpha/beta hydrolase [Ferruginibacter paludis]|uniref:alpha/beta hydrolase n=1 Tax=Ferruginibacter paludis TaxID=1310417 RepID=UPI0025B28535|nr:alpha/beta hydrolase [Ferruginibacter paludis]MDN3656750.1 alpha/beta hydrolase [Ferruginibacter paludis]
MRTNSLMIKKTLAAGISLLVLLTSCGNNSTTDKNNATDSTGMRSEKDTADKMSNEAEKMIPAGAKPAWGKGMTDPMTVVIEKLSSFGAPPLISLSALEARKQPSPADAAMGVIKDHHIAVPANNTDTTGKDIAVASGMIHVRIYTPKSGKNTYPVIVYYHGGGWVIADLNTYDASAQAMAEQVDAVVVSVAYRQAPEHKFPTAHYDSYAAYEWTVKNAASIKGDSKRIALVGESAGGNLAAAVSMMARDKKFPLPVHEILVYPIAGYDFATASYKESDSTKPLNSGLMKWFFQKYLNSPNDGKNPMISLVTANVKGLPPTTIIAAEYDPLRSEGELLRDNFKKAGVAVNYKLYQGVTHEFFGMAAVVPEAKDAQQFAAGELKKAFAQ